MRLLAAGLSLLFRLRIKAKSQPDERISFAEWNNRVRASAEEEDL